MTRSGAGAALAAGASAGAGTGAFSVPHPARTTRDSKKLSQIYLKFVVATDEDLQDVHNAVAEYRNAGFKGSVYLMPVGGTEESYYLNNKTVAELALKHGYRYSPRLQVDIWKNSWAS